MTSTSSDSNSIIIVGGGIIGIYTAYELSKLGRTCTIIEQCGLASAASGKAGGFLAKKWCDSSQLRSLARASYEMHSSNCDELGSTVGYRRVNTTEVNMLADDAGAYESKSPPLPWLSGKIQSFEKLGSTNNTSQVNPKLLCEHIFSQTVQNTNGGTKVVIDTVTGLLFNADNSVKGVRLASGKELLACTVLIAMGPWSGKISEWLPSSVRAPIDINGIRAHSIVFRVPPNVEFGAECVFLYYALADEVECSLEVYPRADGTVYVCGSFNDTQALPNDPSAVEIDSSISSRLEEVAKNSCSILRQAEVISRRSCYLPKSLDGLPSIGPVQGCAGLFIASGHSCWGILNAPGTGRAMAELISTGKSTSLDLSAFNPSR